MTGLSDRRHRQLAKEGFFTPPLRGFYQLVPTLQGLFRYYREAQTRRVGTLAEEKEMKVRAERQLLELDLAKRRGDLIELDAAEKTWENLMLSLAQHLDVLPSKIESRYHTGLTPRALRDLLERELDEIRTNISKPHAQSDAKSHVHS